MLGSFFSIIYYQGHITINDIIKTNYIDFSYNRYKYTKEKLA